MLLRLLLIHSNTYVFIQANMVAYQIDKLWLQYYYYACEWLTLLSSIRAIFNGINFIWQILHTQIALNGLLNYHFSSHLDITIVWMTQRYSKTTLKFYVECLQHCYCCAPRCFCVRRKILDFDFIEFDCFSIGSSTHTKIRSALFAFSPLVCKFHSRNGNIMMYVCFIIIIFCALTNWTVSESVIECAWTMTFWYWLAVYVSFHPLDKSMCTAFCYSLHRHFAGWLRVYAHPTFWLPIKV